jgi:hypothetical protein
VAGAADRGWQPRRRRLARANAARLTVDLAVAAHMQSRALRASGFFVFLVHLMQTGAAA